MVRAPFIDKNGMKKGAWSAEEDYKLRTYILRYGSWNWSQLPKYAGLTRCGKSCRLRWLNYLRPNVNRAMYSKEEDDLIIKLIGEFGNKWSAIAAKLPGRTDNDIKNHWHTHLKKRMASQVQEQSSEIYAPETCEIETPIDTKSTPEIVEPTSEKISPSPGSSSSSEFSGLSYNDAYSSGIRCATTSDNMSSIESFDQEAVGNFWTEPFLADTSYSQCHDVPLSSMVEEGFMSSDFLCYDDETVLFYQLMQELTNRDTVSY